MSRSPALLVTMSILALGITLSGCTSKEAYRYEGIKAEYAHLACNLDSSRTDDKTEPSCSLVNRTLALKDVLIIAKANNPDLLMAMARIEKAEALLLKAAAPFYPQVNVYTEYVQGDAPSAYLFKTIDQRKLPGVINFNDPGWFENYESGVGAGINLYNGGRDRLGREMAKTGLTVSKLDRDGIENQVMAMAIGAYYDILSANNLTAVARESLETTRSQLKIMEVRFQSGGALKTDLLSLKVRMAESEELLVQSNNRERLAKTALAEILGVNPESPINIEQAKAYAIDVPENDSAALDFALLNRPELASVREKLRQSKMALDAARAGYLPRLDFQTRYYMDDPEMRYSTDRDNWTAGLYLNWDIFNGFATKAERAEAMANLRQTLAADRKTLLAVKFEVKKAYLNLDEAEQRLKVATSTVKTAEETYHLVKRQYEGGSANITRYLEAELAFSRARFHETTAYFDREKARAQIARAIGFWTSRDKEGIKEG